MDDWRAWTRVGHLLGRRLAELSRQSDGFLIFPVPGDARSYVQWHAEPDREFYAEAGSGIYDGLPQTPEPTARGLRQLGWEPPGQGWGGDAVWNWSRHWTAPVDLYAVVLLTVRTLREVFHADPALLLEAL